jgi:iron complex outermembrane receptor protein
MLALGANANAWAAEIEEIIVTAQKREQSLQEVGISVAVFTSEDIREQRILVPVDLANTVPNFSVKEINPGLMPVFTIRGVGLNDFSANNNPTVGVYVDEAFLTSTTQLAHQLYDLERIEVLKGPQGTLYGRNTTAGAINFITAKPSQKNEFFASMGYGDYETLDAEFMINRPLSDTVAVRLAGQTSQQGEGYWKSRTLDGESIGERDILSGRAQLLWLAGEDTAIDFKLEAARSDSELGQNEHFGTFALGAFPPVPCAPVLAGRVDPTQCGDGFGYSDPDGDPFTGDWNNDSESTYDQLGALVTIDTRLGKFDVRSISAYQSYERTFLSDVDSSPFIQAEFEVNDDVEQFTQEVHASAALNDTIDYMLGVFYSYDEVRTRTPGNLSQLFLTQTLISADQTTNSAAAFANGSWAMSDDWVLNLGARFTWEDKEFKGGNTDLNPFATSCLLSLTCSPGPTGPVVLSSQDDSIDDTNFSWKVGLDYLGWNENLVYASIARGYKSGGYFGSGFTTSDAQLEPFDPEELTAYELGAKTRLLDGTLQLNASAFYYDYADVQTFTALTGAAVVTLVLSNVDEAEIAGLEMDAWWRPLDGLDIKAAVGILDTELGSFVTDFGPVPRGNELPDAPELTFSTTVRYEFPISGNLRLSAEVQASYADQMFKEAVNRELLKADDYWLVNARIALLSADDAWELALWGKNLGDEEVLTHAFDNGIGNGGRIYQAPRTWGLTLSYRAL